MRRAAAFVLALGFSVSPRFAAAEDAFARCDRGAGLLQDRGSYGVNALDADGLFFDESRQYVAGSSYRAHYLYFTVDADPASVLAAYAQFHKHPEAFRGSVTQARVTGHGKALLKVFFEEAVPYSFVPRPRFTLAESLSELAGGGYRLDMALDSFEDNSSHPVWYDAFLSVTPYKGKTLALYCKYVVPADKRMPSIANRLVRERMQELPERLRELVRAESTDGAARARARLDVLFAR